MWSQNKKLAFVVGGNVNGTTTLEDRLVISYKAKHSVSIQSDRVFTLTCIYSTDLKTYIHTELSHEYL